MIDPLWFQITGGKSHKLIEDEDGKRFPHGRASCAPFKRKSHDHIVNQSEVIIENACPMCAERQT